jgi:prephenate dehydrogenase
VAILGPGLLGGSIALALRERAVPVSLWGRRQEVVQEALAGGFAPFASTDLAAVVAGADLIVLCTPIGSMPALARQMLGVISPETLVTDVGSAKGGVVEALGSIFEGRARFVGSHPMAGSEQTGLKFARADLFAGAVCIVTPEPRSQPQAVAEISAFWESLGALVRQTTPEAHDRQIALVSHFPHLLAATLVEMVAAEDPGAFEFCGPGFRDTTRVASGPPPMWTEILLANRQAVRKSTEAMIEKLREIAKMLDSDPPEKAMHHFLTQAKAQRDCLRLPR